MKLSLLLAKVSSVLAATLLRVQTYHRHCQLSVAYPDGNCMRIQNQNLSGCPQLVHEAARLGHVLGYCDVDTYVDRDPNRVPEFLVRKTCRRECRSRCAAVGAYRCKQIHARVAIKLNGTVLEEKVPTDCLCVKHASHDPEVIAEYLEDI